MLAAGLGALATAPVVLAALASPNAVRAFRKWLSHCAEATVAANLRWRSARLRRLRERKTLALVLSMWARRITALTASRAHATRRLRHRARAALARWLATRDRCTIRRAAKGHGRRQALHRAFRIAHLHALKCVADVHVAESVLLMRRGLAFHTLMLRLAEAVKAALAEANERRDSIRRALAALRTACSSRAARHMAMAVVHSSLERHQWRRGFVGLIAAARQAVSQRNGQRMCERAAGHEVRVGRRWGWARWRRQQRPLGAARALEAAFVLARRRVVRRRLSTAVRLLWLHLWLVERLARQLARQRSRQMLHALLKWCKHARAALELAAREVALMGKLVADEITVHVGRRPRGIGLVLSVDNVILEVEPPNRHPNAHPNPSPAPNPTPNSVSLEVEQVKAQPEGAAAAGTAAARTAGMAAEAAAAEAAAVAAVPLARAPAASTLPQVRRGDRLLAIDGVALRDRRLDEIELGPSRQLLALTVLRPRGLGATDRLRACTLHARWEHWRNAVRSAAAGTGL